MSKARVDRLGDRLRGNTLNEADLRELSEYRQTLKPAYDVAIATIRERLGLEPTGRPAKSTSAIVDKLRRESVRLSQIQDVAGVRIVVSNVREQDSVVQQLGAAFELSTIVDRRERPSHGYRAVHVIAIIGGAAVEIQVRTALQHRWAELSEKLSDLIDPAIKYGGGDANVRAMLSTSTIAIARIEDFERKLLQVEAKVIELGVHAPGFEETFRTISAQAAGLQAIFDDSLANIRAIGERNE